MLTDLAPIDQQTAFRAARYADELQTIGVSQPTRCPFVILERMPQKLHDNRQFLLIELHNIGELHGLGQGIRRVEGLPKIHIEDARRAAPDLIQKRADGGARLRGTLRERSKTNRVRCGCEFLPLRRPLEKIPGNGLGNLEGRLPRGINLHFYGAGRMNSVNLQVLAVETDALQSTAGSASQRVAADSTGDDAKITQQTRHVREIRRGAAKFFALRENVPKELAEAHDGIGSSIRHECSETSERGLQWRAAALHKNCGP